MRHDDIRKQYTRHGGAWNDENPLFAVGEQMQYEWQKDLSAMKWELERVCDFLNVANERTLFNGTVNIAKEELLKRI